MKPHFTKTLSITLLAAAMMFIGCKDKVIPGCMDAASTNFNDEATEDDGSCVYLADAYVGNYIAQDTVDYIDPNDSTQVNSTSTSSFSIEKTGSSQVRLNNFQGCTLDGSVSVTSLVLTDPANQCNIGLFVCSHEGNQLRYQYVQWNGVDWNFKGTAVRQQ